MTIKELIENYGSFLKNEIINYDNNKIIDENDVNNEIYCKKYNFNGINLLSNYGLYNYNGKISFFQNRIKGIKIIPDKYEVNCGCGTIDLKCVAEIVIMKDNEEFKLIYQNINPIYSVKDVKFNYIKSSLEFDKNVDFFDKTYTVTAKYGYNGRIYKTDLNVIQKANYKTEWIFDDIDYEKFYLKSSIPEVPNSGSTIIVNTYKEYKKKYYKKDYFGNVTDTTISDTYVEDITNEAIIKVDEQFTVEGNIVKIPPQKYNSLERDIKIISVYNNQEIELILKQEKGYSVTYNTILEFKDKTNYKEINFKSCNNNNVEIPVICKRIRFLDGKKYDEIDDYRINIENNNDWVKIDVDKINSSVIITVLDNLSNDARVGNIKLSLNDCSLLLTINQSPKEIIKTRYYVEINTKEPLTIGNIYNNYVIITPYKEETYNDGSIEKTQTLDPFLRLEFICLSSDEEVLKLSTPKMIDFNGTYAAYFIGNVNIIKKPINITLKCRVLDRFQSQISDIHTKEFIIESIEPKKKNIEVTVIVKNDSDYDCAFSNTTPIIKITDSNSNLVIEDKLSRFWVSKCMNNDLVYDNEILLNENEKYKFYVSSYDYMDKKTKELFEEYIIETDDVGIDLEILI